MEDWTVVSIDYKGAAPALTKRLILRQWGNFHYVEWGTSEGSTDHVYGSPVADRATAVYKMATEDDRAVPGVRMDFCPTHGPTFTVGCCWEG